MDETYLQTAHRLAARFAQLPDVEAVALGGSQMSGVATELSDLDVYVYSHNPMSSDVRTAIGAEFSDHVETVDYWGAGNEWVDRHNGMHIDVIFWTVGWIEEQIDQVLNRHQARLGYTTSLWYTVQISKILFDRHGWFSQLQYTAKQPYPEGLVKAIIDYNLPVLRSLPSSYSHQLQLAAARNDLVSLNHRAAALLASYFDILFAVNCQPHPGEKRLVAFAEQRCTKLPVNMREDIEALLQATVNLDNSISDAVNRLLDHLNELLVRQM